MVYKRKKKKDERFSGVRPSVFWVESVFFWFDGRKFVLFGGVR